MTTGKPRSSVASRDGSEYDVGTKRPGTVDAARGMANTIGAC